jgi:hypothetical protein
LSNSALATGQLLLTNAYSIIAETVCCSKWGLEDFLCKGAGVNIFTLEDQSL